ncbi:hypothetical protein MKEN_01065400 [Mycena kentingensis (nom. inval.)]|nr:hypothetical protein MKEN_01065400 [Mycena kentingensis (nom. inval.)]
MPSKGLMAFWSLLDFLLLAAGALSIALSIVWRKPDVLMNLALSNEFLNGGLAVGIALCATFVVSLGAVVQRNHITIGFVILNWLLLIDSIIVVTIGTMIWFFSLRQRDGISAKWNALSFEDKITLQDQLKCCGFFNATDNVAVGGSFCTQENIATLMPNVTTNFCVSPVVTYTDYTLENVFTTIYGYMAVVLSLLVCSLCVIKKRQEEERFKKIDAKRGGRGFV